MTGRPDTAGGAGPRAFRDALARFATGVTIVTASTAAGEPVGATMSSFNSVSIEPPLVLFSVGHGLNSLPAFRRAAGFAIHVLGRDQAALAQRFGRSEPKKWDGLAFARGLGAAPIIDGALAHFECRPHACHPAGDHDVFIVEVVRHSLRNDGEPLLFYGGRLRGLGMDPGATQPPHPR